MSQRKGRCVVCTMAMYWAMHCSLNLQAPRRKVHYLMHVHFAQLTFQQVCSRSMIGAGLDSSQAALEQLLTAMLAQSMQGHWAKDCPNQTGGGGGYGGSYGGRGGYGGGSGSYGGAGSYGGGGYGGGGSYGGGGGSYGGGGGYAGCDPAFRGCVETLWSEPIVLLVHGTTAVRKYRLS